MNIYDILPDPRLVDLFRAILESGGIIHGGCLRDLIRHGIFQSKDIDIYYDLDCGDTRRSKFNSETVNYLTDFIKKKPSFQNVDRLHWIEYPIDDYHRLDKFEVGVPCEGFRKPLHYHINEEVIVLDLMCQKNKFTTTNTFLDFDINSLYILIDGTITSYLGEEKVPTIISNIRNGKCRLMRSDLDDARINHILEKGYKCNLTLFL